MKTILPILLLPLLALLVSCNGDDGKCQPQVAWYHWKSSWLVDNTIHEYLDSLNTQFIFLRLFDVDLDESTGQPVPVGRFIGPLPDSLNVVPVVFVTNRTLQNISVGETEQLSEKITTLVRSYLPSPKEFQLDCDWTQSTKNAFFNLVKMVKQKLPSTNVSATIRLHQFKYPEITGVPPADKGMLMVYNMGNVESWETENSIIDADIAAQFLTEVQAYPLPLDIALPLFKWGCVYRDGQLVQLFYDLSKDDLSDTLRFELISEGKFLTKKNTFLNGFYLNKNDQLRLEEVSITELRDVARLLRPFADCCNTIVAFYHLDSSIVRNYNSSILKSVLEVLCK